MEEYRHVEINPKEFDALVGRVKSGSMRDGDERIVEAMAVTIKVLHGAQGTVIHNDDSGAKILELMGGAYRRPDPSRTGIFSHVGEHTVALYYTGTQHAGENLADLLAVRDAVRDPPIQMRDALSRNRPGPF